MALKRAAVILRMCYGPDYPEAARIWRFAFFSNQVLPRILHQKAADFDIWIWVHPRHQRLVEAMSPRIRTFTVDTRESPLYAAHPWKFVRGLPKYEVQIRIDTDDFMGPRYVKTMLRELGTFKGASRLVYFEPYKFDYRTGRIYAVPVGLYHQHRPSAFLALSQHPDDSQYDWVYGRGHTRMWKVADRVKALGPGFCWALCHDNNDTTYVKQGRDILLPDQEAALKEAMPWW